MGITRKTKFGFPPQPTQGSTLTTRIIPLNMGIHGESSWANQQPGSSASLINFVPLNGRIYPRSRLSSMNTIGSLLSLRGVGIAYDANAGNSLIWISNTSERQGIISSAGSISVASFVSADGMGTVPLTTGSDAWDYAPAYSSIINQNVLVAASSSRNTLLALYPTGGSFGAKPLYSYVTDAPKARSVGAFDSYLIAFNIDGGSSFFPTRVQWCARGNAFNWAGEGSGFEDLLDMRGTGNRIIGTVDRKFFLFSTQEIWYGQGAAYPAQFEFFPLDRTVGCIQGRTVCDTDVGVIFLGSDWRLRLIPRGGGVTQSFSDQINDVLAGFGPGVADAYSWAAYDPLSKIYTLFAAKTFSVEATTTNFAVNVLTGEWSVSEYGVTTIRSAVAYLAPPETAVNSSMVFVNSGATVYSMDSRNSLENGVTSTSELRSYPLGTELPGNYKQVTQVDIDYRATSLSTVALSISQNGGRTYTTPPMGAAVALPVAPAGRASVPVYLGGLFPCVRITSTSTGFELHRVDVTMNVGGRA